MATARISPLAALDRALEHQRYAVHWRLAAAVLPPESKAATRALEHADAHEKALAEFISRIREALQTS